MQNRLQSVRVAMISSVLLLLACNSKSPEPEPKPASKPEFPSLQQYPVQGIDVSHHQGVLDWATLKQPKLHFVLIKASEGATWQDPRFVHNWQGAQAAGIVTGAYHFFTFCRSGKDQAANFLAQLARVPRDRPYLPPVIDLEIAGNCPTRPSVEDLHRELAVFIDLIRPQTCRPILYMSRDFEREYLKDHPLNYPRWTQSLQRKPDLEGRTWMFWQYTISGALNGITGQIDKNVFVGKRIQFDQMLCPPIQTTQQKVSDS